MKEIFKDFVGLALERELNLSLFVKDLKSGEGFSYQEKLIHSSASIIKIPIMMAVLLKGGLEKCIELKEENKASFSVVTELGRDSYTVEEYLRWMMIESCNSSTNVLIDYVGYEAVNGIFEDLSMEDSILSRKMMDVQSRREGRDNLTSARDMARLLEEIYRGNYFPRDLSSLALEIMKDCRSYNLLLRYHPNPPSFAHKTGGLDEVSHDVGIFEGNTRLLVCALITSESDSENDPRRTNLLGLMGRRIIEELL